MTTLTERDVKDATRGIVEEYLTFGPERDSVEDYLSLYFQDTDEDDTSTVVISVRQALDNIIDQL